MLALLHLGGWRGAYSTTFKHYSCTHLVGGTQHYTQAPLALNCVEMGPTALHSGGVGSRALHMLGRGTALCTQAPRLHFRILGGGVGRQHYTQALHSSATLAPTWWGACSTTPKHHLRSTASKWGLQHYTRVGWGLERYTCWGVVQRYALKRHACTSASWGVGWDDSTTLKHYIQALLLHPPGGGHAARHPSTTCAQLRRYGAYSTTLGWGGV